MKNSLKFLSEKINVYLNEEQLEQLIAYKNLIKHWNEKINLTSIIDDNEFILKHFIDSLCLNNYIEIKKYSSLIDVGTGAGFPGIPIKITNRNISLTLLESISKKAKFLDIAVSHIGLSNVDILNKRAEEAGKDKFLRESFDISCARAVARLSVLAEYCIPFVKLGGVFVALKGPDISEELDDSRKIINVLGGEISCIFRFDLPKSDIKRTIVVIKKIRQTPIEFPRKTGIPHKKPII